MKAPGIVAVPATFVSGSTLCWARISGQRGSAGGGHLLAGAVQYERKLGGFSRAATRQPVWLQVP